MSLGSIIAANLVQKHCANCRFDLSAPVFTVWRQYCRAARSMRTVLVGIADPGRTQLCSVPAAIWRRFSGRGGNVRALSVRSAAA